MADVNKSVGYNGNDKLKLPGTKQEMTLEQVQEYIKCANDPIYWAEKYIKIVHVDHGIIPIKLYDFQKEIILATLTNRRVIVLTGRQQGKCIKGNTIINIRNKTTGIIHEMEIGLFHEWQKFRMTVKVLLDENMQPLP